MKKKGFFTGLGLSQFFQLPFNVKLMKVLHFKIIKFYIYFLGLMYFFFKKKERLQVFEGLQHVMRSRLECYNFYMTAARTFQGIFDHYFEKLMMAHRPLSEMITYIESRLHIKNSELMENYGKGKKGAILVTGHFGAVEYLPLALALHGYKVAMIVRFKTEKLKNELMTRAKEVNVQLIDADEPKVAFRAISAIKDGKLLITECDEFDEWRHCKNNKVEVFGHLLPRDKTLDFFYRRSRVPAFLGLMRRDHNGGYSLCLEQLAGEGEKTSLAKAAWDMLEKYILKYPQQWYQWKSITTDISDFIEWKPAYAHTQNTYFSAEHPVSSTSFT